MCSDILIDSLVTNSMIVNNEVCTAVKDPQSAAKGVSARSYTMGAVIRRVLLRKGLQVFID